MSARTGPDLGEPGPLWHLKTFRINTYSLVEAARLEAGWHNRSWSRLGLEHGVPKLAVRGESDGSELVCHVYGEPLEAWC